MKKLYKIMNHAANILKKLDELSSEIKDAEDDSSGIRKQLYFNARNKSVMAIDIILEARKDLLRVNTILQNYEKRKVVNAQK